MSDELTFLRWCYHNADRWDTGFGNYRCVMHETYEEETGNRVPSDYRLPA